MDLTLESAFSTGGMVGHLSYLLLVISMVMRQINLLRILVIASSLVAIAYDVIWLRDPVGVFWESMLVIVNIIQLTYLYFENRMARFSPEEVEFCDRRLEDLELGDRRKLLDKGLWVTGFPGSVLTTEGEPVSHLIYLASGEVVIQSGGKPVGLCAPGSFIGELTVMSGEPASGTAVVNDHAKFWMIDAEMLRKLARDKPEIGQCLQRSFAANLKDKLLQSNEIISELSTQSK